MTLPTGTQLGRYEIRSPIGAGGMGEVYLGHDASLDRLVAIKLLPRQFTADEDRLRRFKQEARATSALNHPNILTIFEIGEADGAHYIATEFIDGKTLREHMLSTQMKLEEVLEIGIEVASALAAAHEAGIVHRDVKPENIMLRKDGYVKVLDFGLAKLSEQQPSHSPQAETLLGSHTDPGIVLGTVTYMSPEQARGYKVDGRTDIFSLGIVLYEMITGRAPFTGPTASDVIVSILDREPPPLTLHLPNILPEMQRIISKALAKDLEQRYQTIKDLQIDLRRLRQRVEFEAEMQRTTMAVPVATTPQQSLSPQENATVITTAAPASQPESEQATIRLDPNQPSKPVMVHVLFMDVVGFSRLPMNRQQQLLHQLQEIVSGTNEFREAKLNNQLISRAAGDGMALVFFDDPASPVRCALQISRALLGHTADIPLRMGINTGPVFRIINTAGERDVVGAGINMAQRVMDCGDAGHILISKTVADILREFGESEEQLDDLGEATVKHDVKVHIFNLYTSELGNSQRPSKLPSPSVAEKTATHKDSLAVLPLVNASTDEGAEYLSDGITESIINNLSQLPQLKVMARHTVFRYKGREVDPQEIKRDLGVQKVMMGRVQMFGDNLIIKIELIDLIDGSQLWGDSYKRKSSDIFELQDEISKEISDKLKIKLSGEEKKLLTKRYTENTEAYKLYLKGRYCLSKLTKEGIRKGIEKFQEAIDQDPSYALAYAGLANAYYVQSSNYLPPKEAMPKAKAAAERALEMDDTLAEAHASLALVKAFYEWDWAGAETEYQRAIELNPGYASAHHWYGWYLALVGRLDEAIAQIKKADELDPLSLEINSDLGLSFFFAGQYERALEQFQKALEEEPDSIWTRFFLGWSFGQMGQLEKAVAEYKKARQLDESPLIIAALGHAYALLGRYDEAQDALDEMKELSTRRHISPYLFTIIYVALGDYDRAFAELEKDYENRSEALAWLKVDPRLDPLRSDPRFTDLQRRVGLPT
ncbi:MAG TPA: protein kinase [Pyrinomonadaceae bacterium]|jgi:serine/threonine protein kinase/TolB-like protein/Tfp pilus assembly protein PilF